MLFWAALKTSFTLLRARQGADDAAGTALNRVSTRLEGPNSFMRLVFIDFTSAFHCIQPHILADRLKSSFSVGSGLICWLMDLSAERSQRV